MKARPSVLLMSRIARLSPEEQFTSSITVGELLFGILRLGADGHDLRGRVESVISNLPVLPFDLAAARTYAKIRTDLERQGKPIGDADTRIAAIAMTHGLI